MGPRVALRSIAIALALGCDSAAWAEPPRLEFTRMVAHWADYCRPGLPAVHRRGEARGGAGRLLRRPLLEPGPHRLRQGLPRPFPRARAGRVRPLVRGPQRASSTIAGPRSSATSTSSSSSATPTARGAARLLQVLPRPLGREELGPRPVDDPLELLQKGADGKPIVHDSYSIGGMREYWGCLNNPHGGPCSRPG